MYINITKSETGDNKGSSGALVHYLEKENRMKPENGMENKPERWFNGTDSDIKPHKVRMGIDRNVAKLGREDSKFFLINISPGQNYPRRGKGQGCINAAARRPLPSGALDPIPPPCVRWPKR